MEKEDAEQAKKALPNAEIARLMADRLCAALLNDFRNEIFHEVEGLLEPGGKRPRQNWERWLCSRTSRLCKFRQVSDAEDDDIDDEGGAETGDSVHRRRSEAGGGDKRRLAPGEMEAALAHFERLLGQRRKAGQRNRSDL